MTTSPTHDPSPPRVLFVSYYFPPNLSIGALRPWHLANEFATRRCSTVVVRSGLGGSSGGPAIGATVETVPTFDSRTAAEARRKRRATSGPAPTGVRAPATAVAPSFEPSLARRLLDLFPLSVVLGEGGPVYFTMALRRALALRDPHVVVSSSSPMIDHLVARIVRWRRGAIWVADFRDPLRDASTSSRRSARFQAWLTWRFVGRPDIVTSVSEGALGSIPIAAKHRLVVSPGLSKIARRSGAEPSGDEFRLVYTGSLYGERSTPRSVFDALRQLIDEGSPGSDRLRIVYAGPHGEQMRAHCERSGLSAIFTDLGRLPHAEAIRLQDTADVNLASTWSLPGSRGVLTGKMFEYFAARRPIACVLNGDRDSEIERLMHGDPALRLVVAQDPESIASARHQLATWLGEFAASGSRPQPIAASVLERFDWTSTTAPLFSALADEGVVVGDV